MNLEQAAAHIGDRVTYRPRAGCLEHGVITSVNDNYAFVRYDGNYWSKATYPGFLQLEGRP